MGICSAQQTKQQKLQNSTSASGLASPIITGRNLPLIIKNKKHSVFQLQTKSVPLLHANVFQFYTIYPQNNHINKLYRAFQVQHNLTGQIRLSIVIERKNVDGMMFYKKMKQQLVFINIYFFPQKDHPNICKIYEIYKEKKEYHIITEYCQGESLSKFCVNELSEPEIRRIMEQILKAVNYLHQYNHKCRLSLKSFHFVNESDRLTIKFTDFLSIYGNLPITHDQVLYQSPEECKSHPSSSLQSDMWSIGAIFYQLLSGKTPFPKHSTIKHTQNQIRKGEVKFDGLALGKRNSRAIDLLKLFLQINPEDRINIQKAIQETYFIRDSILKSQEIIQEAIDNITNQKRRINKLQHYIYQFMIKQFAQEKQQKLSDLFYSCDVNKDGKLNKEEVRTMISSILKSEEVDEQVNKIFEIADLDLSGDIDLNEFILATIDKGFIINKNNIELTFKMLDIKKTGKLYQKDFCDIFEIDIAVVSNYISEFLQKLSVKKNINQSHSDYFTLEEFRIFMFQIL